MQGHQKRARRNYRFESLGRKWEDKRISKKYFPIGTKKGIRVFGKKGDGSAEEKRLSLGRQRKKKNTCPREGGLLRKSKRRKLKARSD